MVKVRVVVDYSPNEGDGEKRDRFWNMDRIAYGMNIDCVFLGDLNRWIGDRTRANINGAFGVPGENDNGRRVAEFCTERGLYVGNTHILSTEVCISTQDWQGEQWSGGKEHDLVLVKRDMLRYVQDVRDE